MKRASLARLIPALVAVYELRYLLINARSALVGPEHAYWQSGHQWAMALAALAAGLLLLEVARGLPAQLEMTAHAGLPERTGGPRWSSSLVVRWLLCCVALMALAGCVTLLAGLLGAGHPAGLTSIFGTGTSSTAYPALCVGLILAASLRAGRWVLRTVVRWRAREAARRRLGLTVKLVGSVLTAPVPVPLLAGWSDRGPPAGLDVTTA